MFADFENRRAIVLEGSEAAPLTLTTVEDTAKVVALALEYKGKWPRKGGIQGSQTTVGQFLALAEKIRGPFQVERLRLEDVVRGELKTSWVPLVEHEAVPVEQREKLARGTFWGNISGRSLRGLGRSEMSGIRRCQNIPSLGRRSICRGCGREKREIHDVELQEARHVVGVDQNV
ncbi:uncharacterized protein RCC_04286 [Ramularia collo-cygni]|uniref:Uncharacterized protein n=1 Tax=Ramularia collo-cygni TaxID=112498 RepID=A0A2D3UR86_9PEZI|nr:uncharacterized protein RCC_04286 [Ramularia collo-cygni]CZT18441.1 uncharacterized protein RCC_04286 [Ramularia collo-cygni]